MTSQELRAELEADRAKQAALRRRLAELGIEVTTPTRTASTRKSKGTHGPRLSEAKPGRILTRDCGTILQIR